MEKVFIQMIYKLTEQILRGEVDTTATQTELEKHLARARQMKSRLYEAETLNTFGTLYAMAGEHDREIEYFQTGLAIAQELNDTDLQLKFLSNLSEVLAQLWMLDESRARLESAIQLINAQQMKSLVSLYVYSNSVKINVLLNDLETARERHATAWSIAQDTQIGQYSLTEYSQVVAQIHLHKAMLDMANGECDEVASELKLASDMVVPPAEVAIVGLFQAILCQQDNDAARQWESRLVEALGGSMTADSAIMAADFLLRRGEVRWGQHFLTVFDTLVPTASEAMHRAADQWRQQLAGQPKL